MNTEKLQNEAKPQGIISLAWDVFCMFFWCNIACLVLFSSFIGPLEDNLARHALATLAMFALVLGINRARKKQ